MKKGFCMVLVLIIEPLFWKHLEICSLACVWFQGSHLRLKMNSVRNAPLS